MRRNRALWASIIFVLVLVAASVIGLLGGALQPTLGLDLQGGASVILTAPEGTPQDVMEQALENIRNRVDAFGVGEPDIALSGTTIEVQIPGSADATVRRREANIYCLESEDLIHGCSEDEDDVQDVLDEPRGAGSALGGLRRRRRRRAGGVLLEPGPGRDVPRRRPGGAETEPVTERLGEPEPECLAVRLGVAVGRPLARRERLLPAEADGREHPVLRHAGEGAGREGRARGRGDRALVLHRAGGARTVADAISVRIGVTECVRIGIPVGLRVSVTVTRDLRRSRPLRGGSAAVRAQLPGGGRRRAGGDRDRA